MEFLKGREEASNDAVKAYILYGSWSMSTIKHYNAGVSKLISFAENFKIPREALLPIEPEYLYQFVVWAGRKLPGLDQPTSAQPIKASTIRTYLSGIKAWHLYRDHPYPHHATPRIELMLTTAKKLDLQKQEKAIKDPVLVDHLFSLLESLTDGSLESMTAYTVALVAFWGMARLGELMKQTSSQDQVKVKDLVWDPSNEYLTIRIRAAKTAAVGEIQEIHLCRQESILDPVSAVQHLLHSTGASEDDDLFSYPTNTGRRVLTKARCQRIFTTVWNSSTESTLTGHSFRVGGASLRWNLGVPIADIVKIGRWRSKAYKIYLRRYSDEVLRETRRLLTELKGAV